MKDLKEWQKEVREAYEHLKSLLDNPEDLELVDQRERNFIENMRDHVEKYLEEARKKEDAG